MICNYLSLCLFGILACLLTSTAAREAIVHGFPAFRTYQYPYQVSVQNHEHRHICGGSIVNNLFILTAANCVMDHNREFVQENHYVLAGTIDLHRTSVPAEIIKVERIYVPKDYNPRGYIADIALLKLQHGLNTEFTRNNAFVQLPNHVLHRNPYNNTNGTITGFGWHQVDLGGLNGTSDGRLRYAEVNVFIEKACEDTYSPGTVNSAIHLCARMSVTKPERVRHFGAGKGDEGAPLVLYYDAFPVVIGVLSRRSPSCDEMDHRGYPGIYTRVLSYRRFIENAMKDKKKSYIRTSP